MGARALALGAQPSSGQCISLLCCALFQPVSSPGCGKDSAGLAPPEGTWIPSPSRLLRGVSSRPWPPAVGPAGPLRDCLVSNSPFAFTLHPIWTVTLQQLAF